MKIIIAGAGEVGFHLARLLAIESQDIILIDKDKEKLNYVQNHIDVMTIEGDSTSINVLKEAKVAEADLLIAVTSLEDTNIAICVLGKQLGAKRTIARIRKTEFLESKEIIDLAAIGIDEVISPESLAAKEIKRLLKESAATDTFEFEDGKLVLMGLKIDENSPVLGKKLKDLTYLNPYMNFITVAIHRQNRTIIPYGETTLLLNDQAYFISLADGVSLLLESLKKKRINIKNVMILGGSTTGVNAAKRLGKKYNIKLIELNKEKCFALADELPDVLVINGDGTKVEILEEEGIRNMDAFIAVTGNSETNIISSLMAKKYGVAKTISMVENIEYINLSQNIGLDTMINKKLIAANFIFRYIRKGEVVSLTAIHGVDAEILEFRVSEGSKITKSKVKYLHFPKSAIIGGVIRNGQGYITLGNFQIQPDDLVVVFALSECIHEVEKFFK